jgi:hypothetical protein
MAAYDARVSQREEGVAPPGLEAVMRALVEGLDQLDHVLARLEERLTPAMRVSEPSAVERSEMTESPGTSMYVVNLSECARRVFVMRRAVLELDKRLEI